MTSSGKKVATVVGGETHGKHPATPGEGSQLAGTLYTSLSATGSPTVEAR